MERRKFLGLALGAAGRAALFGSGLEAVLSSCSPAIPGISTEALKRYQNDISSRLNDPNKYLRYLKDGEYVIPDDVFNAYARIVDERKPTFWGEGPLGGYISRDFLASENRTKQFFERVKALGFSDNFIATFYTILTTTGNIVFKESILKDRFFEKALPHERFHREMDKLSDDELNILHQAYDNLINRQYSLEKAKELGFDEKFGFESEISLARRSGLDTISLVEEKPSMSSGFYKMQASMNWHEFYPYLAQEVFLDRVETALRNEHPKAYEIFNRIRENVKLR